MTGHYHLARSHVLVRGVPKRVSDCLRVLGVQFKNAPSFWNANAHELEWILKDAKQAWRDKIKAAHTDHGGSHEDAALLNQIWDRTRKLFRSKGVALDDREEPPKWKPLKKIRPTRTPIQRSHRRLMDRLRRRNWQRTRAGIPLDAPLVPKGRKYVAVPA